ncbi:MAG: hypothetical protein B7X32_15740 [Microbacterium sp. 13-71-7]|nr:MAG: hypothetical protein B7X32_15740 [Microbacterium sp. 13-71-7]
MVAASTTCTMVRIHRWLGNQILFIAPPRGIATLAGVSAAISRVMAIPAIDEWLRKFGAGSAPAGAITYTPLSGDAIGLTRRQYRAMVDGADTGEKD